MKIGQMRLVNIERVRKDKNTNGTEVIYIIRPKNRAGLSRTSYENIGISVGLWENDGS